MQEQRRLRECLHCPARCAGRRRGRWSVLGLQGPPEVFPAGEARYRTRAAVSRLRLAAFLPSIGLDLNLQSSSLFWMMAAQRVAVLPARSATPSHLPYQKPGPTTWSMIPALSLGIVKKTSPLTEKFLPPAFPGRDEQLALLGDALTPRSFKPMTSACLGARPAGLRQKFAGAQGACAARAISDEEGDFFARTMPSLLLTTRPVGRARFTPVTTFGLPFRSWRKRRRVCP